MSERDKTLNIYQRVHAVMEQIAYIRKDKRVESYMAVTHDAVTAFVRPHFLTFGIVLAPRQLEGAVVTTGTMTKNETPIIRFEGKYEIDFVNIDSPEDRIIVPIQSHANDHGDKAPGKALSYATKGAILKLLMLETGESDESRGGNGHDPALDEDMVADLKADLDSAIDAESLREKAKKALTLALHDPQAYAAIKAHIASCGTKLKLPQKAAHG